MFDLIPHRKGGLNHVPSFLTQYGPVREVGFQRKPDGTPDGGVHQLFTIVGRSDIGSPGCTNALLPPTDFETEYRKGNLSFRIPTPTFGLGLVESIQDQTILANSAATAPLRSPLGIGGIPNRSDIGETRNPDRAVYDEVRWGLICRDVFPHRALTACRERPIPQV
jgi:hypothetical protein